MPKTTVELPEERLLRYRALKAGESDGEVPS